jgi:hypothetical protein
VVVEGVLKRLLGKLVVITVGAAGAGQEQRAVQAHRVLLLLKSFIDGCVRTNHGNYI